MPPGDNLGPYRIVDKIGAGGMGDVYLAEDTRLGRRVAIKVLPPEFAGDPERLARFEQEARAAAALNHANIAAVFDVGEQAGDGTVTRYIVQEYLQGQTLRHLLEAGAMPLRRALEIGIGIASGLVAAHAAGVVHRDLKPENVFVVGDGTAKILDFGLAKLLPQASTRGRDASESPTVLGTMAGSVMGTAGYMAPEQVQGLPADARVDLFAFGCLLQEAFSGQRAFPGRNVAEILSRIVNEAPAPLPPGGAPVRLQWALEKCLAKEPERRYQGAADLLVDLRQVARELEAGTASSAATSAPAADAPAGVPAWAAVACALLLALVGGVAGAWMARAPQPATLLLDVAPEGLETGGLVSPVISPDGQRVVYRARRTLWVREFDQAAARELPDTEAAQIPFWSPDSTELGYVRAGKLFTQRLDGAPVPLVDVPELASGAGASWGEDGRIIYGQGSSSLFAVPARGGAPSIFLQPDAEAGEAHFHRGVSLPGGAFAYVLHRVGGTADVIAAVRNDQRAELLRLDGDYLADLHYVESVGLVFSRRGVDGSGVWLVELDPATLTLAGEPVMLARGATHPSVSADGERLLFDPHTALVAAGRRRLVLVRDLGVDAQPGSDAAANLTDWEDLLQREGQRMSPDGSRLAFVADVAAGADLWTLDVARRTRQRLTNDVGFEGEPEWSDDGRWVYYHQNDSHIWRVASDGSSPPEAIGEGRSPASVHDGERLLVLRGGLETGEGEDLWLLEARPGGAAEIFVAGRGSVGRATVSPDARFAAYASNDSGRWDVFVQSLAGSQRWLISTDGGEHPRWSPDGKAVYFVGPGLAYLRVAVEMGADGAPVFAPPEEVMRFTPNFGIRDITPVQTPGGLRFLTQLTESVSSPGRLVLAINAQQLIQEALEL